MQWCSQVPQCILLLGVLTQTTSYTQVESNWLLNLYKLLQSQYRYQDKLELEHDCLYLQYCFVVIVKKFVRKSGTLRHWEKQNHSVQCALRNRDSTVIFMCYC